MIGIHRAYRVLGLPPGASPAEVKIAYRDLVQVWHPDRFAHDERLRRKAEENVRRINEAYEALRAYAPPARRSLADRVSASFHAVLGLGDLPSTEAPHQSSLRRWSRRVLGLGPHTRTGEFPEPPAATSPRTSLAIAVAMLGFSLILWLIL
ncbi:MAG TPA: J domain-containing protein [Gemmatimonadales bacterium]